MGRINIVIGTGNEGAQGIMQGILPMGVVEIVEFTVMNLSSH